MTNRSWNCECCTTQREMTGTKKIGNSLESFCYSHSVAAKRAAIPCPLYFGCGSCSALSHRTNLILLRICILWCLSWRSYHVTARRPRFAFGMVFFFLRYLSYGSCFSHFRRHVFIQIRPTASGQICVDNFCT